MKNFLNESNQEKERIFETLRSRLGRWGVLAIVLVCILAVSVIYAQIYPRYPSVELKNIIGIIRVEGYIEDSWDVSLYTDIINQAVVNESVKAVVLVVDSRGGYADYIEQIYLDLLELKEKKPLVASIITALSGGYYIAVAADHIYIHPSSFVGNIGVIGRGPPLLIPSELVLETGAYKVTGFSALLFSHNLSHALDNFVSAVETSRNDRLKLPSIQLKRAMIYLGSEAVDVGLADEIGSLQKAIGRAAEEAKLVGYEVVELRPQEVGSYSSWRVSSNYRAVEARNMTLETLDELHPPPAVHYIYLTPQAITQSLHSPKSSMALSTGGGNVLVDVSHGNQISWWDLDILIAELAMRNVTVSFVSDWSDLDSKLANASCLIVASPTEVYTDEECDSIESFVDEGGLLLMFFDPAYEYIGLQGLSQGIIAPINSLSTRFGLSFAKGYLYDEVEHFGIYRNIYVKNFTSSRLTQNLSSLLLFTATHIHSMEKGLAWASNNTYSSAAEKTGSYAPLALVERGNGTVAALGDLTLFREPYCYVEDNYGLILNLGSLITEVEVHAEEIDDKEVAKPHLPVGTEKNFTEWVDGEESLVRWFKVSEVEVRVEHPNETTHYYFTEDGALQRWVSDGMECTYEDPLPELPYPLTKGERWEYESRYTLIMEGEVYTGNVFGEEEVEDFEDVKAGNGEGYFCARIRFMEVEELPLDGSNMTMITTGSYWVSSDVGIVKQEVTTKYYIDDLFYKEERRTLLLESMRKPAS